VSEELEQLAVFDGVTGLFLHHGGIIRWQRRPESLTIDNAAALCHAVSHAFIAYLRADRHLTQAYFEFSGQSVLVVAGNQGAADAGPQSFLTLLLRDRAAVTPASTAATSYFAGVSTG